MAPLHMANSFATFAADGRYCEPFAILRVNDIAKADPSSPDAKLQGHRGPGSGPWCQFGASGRDEEGLRRPHQARRSRAGCPLRPRAGTNNSNGATWVVGYTTGLATASFFGDTMEGQKRPGS